MAAGRFQILACVLAAWVFAITESARAQDAAGAQTTAGGKDATGSKDVAPPPMVRKPWGPRLLYTTTAGCHDEETFRNAIAIFFRGSDPFDEKSVDLLRVTFRKVKGGYRGTVQKLPANEEPWPEEDEFASTCSALFREVVRLASMRVPEIPKEEPPPKVEPRAEPPQTPSDPIPSPEPRVILKPVPPPPTPVPQPARPMDVTISLGAAVLMTAGFTADVGPGFQLSAGLQREWFSLDLEARGILPSRVFAREPVDPKLATSEVYFDVSQLSALLVPCGRFATYFRGCLVGQIGTIIDQTPIETGFLLAGGVGPRLAFDFPLSDRFAVFAFGEALFTPGVSIGYRDPGPNGEPADNVIWRQSVVSGFFGLGVATNFK